MGTQQVLYIILAVIICGVAISSVFFAFDSHYKRVPRDEMKLEIVQLMGQAQAWFEMPLSLGGAGSRIENIDTELITGFILDIPVNPGSVINKEKTKFTFTGFASNPSITIRGQSLSDGNVDDKIEITGTALINAGNLDNLVFVEHK
jgi:hypothetical protein